MLEAARESEDNPGNPQLAYVQITKMNLLHVDFQAWPHSAFPMLYAVLKTAHHCGKVIVRREMP